MIKSGTRIKKKTGELFPCVFASLELKLLFSKG